LAAADRIPNASKLVLAGGTFSTGGFNEQVNTLAVNTSSAIDLGNGASTLHFADSSAETWGASPAGSLLRINNWTSGNDHLTFDTQNGAVALAKTVQDKVKEFVPLISPISTAV
jgi:hypothetical protein